MSSAPYMYMGLKFPAIIINDYWLTNFIAAMVSSSVTVMTPVKWVERIDQGSSYTLIL